MIIAAYTSFLFVWAVNLFIQCILHKSIKVRRKQEDNLQKTFKDKYSSPAISVIIITENQEKELTILLNALQEQSYSPFEIIVVDKNSTDNTHIILENRAKQQHNLQYTFIPPQMKHVSSHTLALSLGVKAANFPWVILCNPNFVPASHQWLNTMAAHMTKDKDIVIGAHTTAKKSNSIRSFYYLQKQAYLFLNQSRKKIHLGNSINLAFRKDLFIKSGKIGEYGILNSGIEEVFINRNHKNNNLALCIHSAALLLEQDIRLKDDWKQELWNRMEAEMFMEGNIRFHLKKNIITLFQWLLWLTSATAIPVMIWQQKWYLLTVSLILWGIWYSLRLNFWKKDIAIFQCYSKGIYMPFYELRIATVYLIYKLRHYFTDRRIFYRKNI